MQDTIAVLVIDSHPEVTESLQSLLVTEGLRVDTSNSGAEALGMFETWKHDIVLMDYSIQGMDSSRIANRIQALSGSRWTPIIFLTDSNSYEASEAAVKALEIGGVDILTRPTQNELLLTKVRNCVDMVAMRNAYTSGELQFKAILDHSLDAILVTDDTGTILQFNAQSKEVFGWKPEEVIGQPMTQFMPVEMVNLHAEAFSGKSLPAMWHTRQVKAVRKNGEVFPMEVRLGMIELPKRRLFTAAMRDITELERRNAEISQLAHYDSLTGLPNRNLLQDRLRLLISMSTRYNKLFGLLFIDLDHFKEINDTHGHNIGDQVLQEIANRLLNCVRDSDTIARLGGDEFVALLYDLRCADDARIVAERIRDACRKPVELASGTFRVASSIGLALYPDDGRDAETLMKHADVAMYHAKETGRDRYSFYSHEINKVAQQKLLIEQGLQRALQTDGFVLHYQPQIDLTTQKTIGAEALLRWEHNGGIVPPGMFIPVAEETGLIVQIGEWVLREACREGKRWLDMGLGPEGKGLSVGVNLSARQFNLSLPSMVFGILSETGLPAHLLNLEITESFLMQDIDQAAQILAELANAGIQISVDDFGTGYSCLAYLKRLPVHTIKVDRSFVKDILRDQNDRTIVETIVALAKNLGHQTLAEGVEEHEQIGMLVALGCDSCQGYFFSRPVPAEEFVNQFALPIISSTTQRKNVAA
ncbi:EAL domain-containing protein [Chromobacterium piscinae]|uniref:EAL domain-containing protein n=1 Tax=Chromobacterium piscinae TaxID=686831 RepID=UPI001E39974C|nr:EAL domain-containing protein [Chromobacterium piscinae]MCD5327961.1 EAL domain-containing protein [Chromobacterium piscinae]